MEQTLSQYKIFYAVARAGSISHAAKELYISQPAVSKAVQKLEQALATSLFMRNSRGVRLTEEGSILFEHVKTAFESINLGEERLRKFQSMGMGHLKIGVSSTLCKYQLLPTLTRFISDYPHVQIAIECQSSLRTQQLLEKGQLDIGLIGKPDTEHTLSFHSLGSIHDIFVASPAYLDHLKQRADQDNQELLESATFMMLDKNNLTRQYIDQALSNAQLQMHNSLEVTTMDLLIEFAKIGLGIAGVIREFVQTELTAGTLIEIPLHEPFPKREIGLAYHSSFASALLEKFISYFQI